MDISTKKYMKIASKKWLYLLKFFRYESLITDIGEKHVHRCGSGQGMLRSLAGADMKKVPRRGSVSSIFDSEATFLLSQALRPRARARPRKHEKSNCNTGVLLYLIAGNDVFLSFPCRLRTGGKGINNLKQSELWKRYPKKKKDVLLEEYHIPKLLMKQST